MSKTDAFILLCIIVVAMFPHGFILMRIAEVLQEIRDELKKK